ncbi:MAG: hypothetical protein D6818_10385 [Bacteroidetes bacterium]|nr:MAG: hypothetical protein D6818_10385 [Bacteroidota bacterium]
MQAMKKKLISTISLVALIGVLMLPATQTQAQCPMCRLSAETNLKNGGTEGKGLNTGILYMLAMPYLLVGTIGYIWWRNRKQIEE